MANASDTLVLHLGDYNGSGEYMFNSFVDNVVALARDSSEHSVEFDRIALTPAQVAQYTTPEQWELLDTVRKVHAHDKRRANGGDLGKVQLESLPPGKRLAAHSVRDLVQAIAGCDLLGRECCAAADGCPAGFSVRTWP